MVPRVKDSETASRSTIPWGILGKCPNRQRFWAMRRHLCFWTGLLSALELSQCSSKYGDDDGHFHLNHPTCGRGVQCHGCTPVEPIEMLYLDSHDWRGSNKHRSDSTLAGFHPPEPRIYEASPIFQTSPNVPVLARVRGNGPRPADEQSPQAVTRVKST